jgi:hypothetical protein
VPVDIAAAGIVLNPADRALLRDLAPDLENSAATGAADAAIAAENTSISANPAAASRDNRLPAGLSARVE